MQHMLLHLSNSILLGCVLVSIFSCQPATADEDCETCKLTNEIDSLRHMLNACENELNEQKQKISTQDGVQSSSALSYLGNVCSWVTSSSKRSLPLRSTVNTFLQKLNVDAKQNINEINEMHEVDVR